MARILVIEDDPTFRRAISAKLTCLGYRVTEACNGKEGLSLLPVADANLIVTDIVTPANEGFEVLRQIQQHRPLAKIIVTLSGECADETDYRELARYLGASSVLAKPFLTQDLLTAVNKLATATQPDALSYRQTTMAC
jgi:two-component system response regulator RegX3